MSEILENAMKEFIRVMRAPSDPHGLTLLKLLQI